MPKLTKEVFLYLVMGVLTTLVNLVSYFILELFLSPTVSTAVAWFLSVLFAYVTNSRFVFNSNAKSFKEKFKELISFFLARVLSGAFVLGATYVFIEKLELNDYIVKIVINVLVIAFNYVASKLVIFKKKKH